MHRSSRPFLTSGTAAAAVVGALLLGAEDVGLAPFTLAHRLDALPGWSQAAAPRQGALPGRAMSATPVPSAPR